MNITKAISNYIEGAMGLTFGTNLFIGGVEVGAPNECGWLLSAGGSVVKANVSAGKMKNYVISFYYRGLDASVVYEKLQALEEALNSDACTQLDGYDTIDLQATLFPTDQDIDNEERTVGLIQITATTYT